MENPPAHTISFRPLAENDLALLHTWLNTEHVITWYSKKTNTLEEVTDKYLPRIRGSEPTYGYIFSVNQKAIGFIQTYLLSSYPTYWKTLDIKNDAASVDLFIGESDYLGKGLGHQILKKFVTEIVFPKFRVDLIVIGPYPRNIRGIRSYEKAGFKYLKTIYDPEQNENEYIMIMEKKYS